MPIYEYRCTNGHTFETFQSMADDPLSACEVCEAPVERVLSAPAIHFKGSGFYTTDYAKKGAANSSSNGESKGEASSSSKDGSKSDSSSKDGSKSDSSSKGDSSSRSDSGSKGDSSSKTESKPKSPSKASE